MLILHEGGQHLRMLICVEGGALMLAYPVMLIQWMALRRDLQNLQQLAIYGKPEQRGVVHLWQQTLQLLLTDTDQRGGIGNRHHGYDVKATVCLDG